MISSKIDKTIIYSFVSKVRLKAVELAYPTVKLVLLHSFVFTGTSKRLWSARNIENAEY
jgi:hypothetical protein